MRVGIIEPEGILKASITKERMKKATRRAVRSASAYSRIVPLCFLCLTRLRIGFISLVNLKDRQERLLRDLDVTDLFHPLLTFLLLFQQLPFARDVAAVALGGDVLPERLDSLPRNDPPADRRLDRHLVLLSRDDAPGLVDDLPPSFVRLLAVDNDGERVDRIAVDHDV